MRPDPGPAGGALNHRRRPAAAPRPGAALPGLTIQRHPLPASDRAAAAYCHSINVSDFAAAMSRCPAPSLSRSAFHAVAVAAASCVAAATVHAHDAPETAEGAVQRVDVTGRHYDN